MALNYKASNIAKAETEFDMSFLGVIGDLSKLGEQEIPDIRINKIVFLIKAGGATEDEANDLIDEGIEDAFKAIFEGLDKAGFLAKKKPEQAQAQTK